jgi:hypothetical protein
MRAAIVAATLALGLTGCASSDGQAPAWFAERSAEDDSSFPSLREVPRGTIANTDAAYWEAVEADLKAAGQEVRSNPRSAPASATESPAEFLEEAREDLDEARQSHEPN